MLGSRATSYGPCGLPLDPETKLSLHTVHASEHFRVESGQAFSKKMHFCRACAGLPHQHAHRHNQAIQKGGVDGEYTTRGRWWNWPPKPDVLHDAACKVEYVFHFLLGMKSLAKHGKVKAHTQAHCYLCRRGLEMLKISCLLAADRQLSLSLWAMGINTRPVSLEISLFWRRWFLLLFAVPSNAVRDKQTWYMCTYTLRTYQVCRY